MIDTVRPRSARGPRQVFLLAVGALYLLPSLLGILLQGAHGLEHAAAWMEGSVSPASPAAVVHSHDGSTHSHGAAVAALSAAVADEEDTDGDPESVPPLLLLAVRPAPPVLDAPPGLAPPVAGPESGFRARDPRAPLLPPPRG